MGFYKPDDFWEMTLIDVFLMFEAFQERKKMEQKEACSYIYNLASLVGVAFASTQSKKVKFPTIEEAFPTVFANPVEENWQAIKERMMKFANNHNNKRG